MAPRLAEGTKLYESLRSSAFSRVRPCMCALHLRPYESTRKGRDEVGEKEEDIQRHRDPWCGIGGASGNETADEGSNSDGVRTEPRSDFHSYSEITGGGALCGSGSLFRRASYHFALRGRVHPRRVYTRSPRKLARIHTYESADVSFRIGE